MDKLIVIKYGELSTKKANISYFLATLKKNVVKKLTGIDAKVTFDRGRMFIATKSYDEVIKRLQEVFGIHEIVIAYKMSTDMATITANLLKLVNDLDFKTFKVVTKRSDKDYPISSMDISKTLGASILASNNNLIVDVHHPELTIDVEIRQNFAYVYLNKIKGLGGYPVSSNGKGILMLSGGIDSPVAGYLAIKRGVKIECLYFAAPPHTSKEAQEKVISLARILAPYNNDIKVHIINFTKIEEAIYEKIPRDYLITIMRRMMYRITAKVAYRSGAKAIINGESIGQVASQTLTSIGVINEVTTMPVIRPVACFDKLEIIALAKEIDSYDTSILPYEDCCTIFVPEHPVINPKSKLCIEYEKLIPYEAMIKECLLNEEVIKVTSEDKKFQDLL
jgi:tRNA uracil 4-sulfurtransferase